MIVDTNVFKLNQLWDQVIWRHVSVLGVIQTARIQMYANLNVDASVQWPKVPLKISYPLPWEEFAQDIECMYFVPDPPEPLWEGEDITVGDADMENNEEPDEEQNLERDEEECTGVYESMEGDGRQVTEGNDTEGLEYSEEQDMERDDDQEVVYSEEQHMEIDDGQYMMYSEEQVLLGDQDEENNNEGDQDSEHENNGDEEVPLLYIP